ncbi:MAG: hypothetical protein JO033_29075 [Acidobacteriaceae bacterium]|nr:hypothetical protein [Acidobacteriaceae bacterium]MBV9501005.1 hypothetical protein [Acidobacteriaceae bacterium]
MQQADAVKLMEFIEASKAKGASDEFLASFLARRGWPQDDVYAALGNYWERTTGVSIPERTAGGESSRDAFLYLLSFSTLATWSSALGSMLFRFIEHWFPDPVARDQVYNLRNAVTWQMASIAVAFPIFLLVMRTILREAQNHPERLQSSVRKWLTYIALLLTAGAMICDLIWFLNYFLNGELTSRFVLKALVVMVICGAIFVYYLGSLRWDRNTNVAAARSRSLKFGIGTAAVVVISFCIGIGVAGTPSAQRRIEADSRRVQDLRAIAQAVQSWHQRAALNQPLSNQSGKQLPATLSELIGKGISQSQTLDPETKTPYEYRVRADMRYDLCATFSGAEESDQVPGTQFWHHGEGLTCFTLDPSQQPVW